MMGTRIKNNFPARPPSAGLKEMPSFHWHMANRCSQWLLL
uniref:Uncharacterized protein n=1 Tax=Rhizophora mucronata TaxID=61149 RepID=A0A2P2NY70_RHIMU